MERKKRIALIYDFDLTLSEEYQQFPLFREFSDQLREKHGIDREQDYFPTLCESLVDIEVGSLD